MGKIDLDKFICSIMNYDPVPCEVKYLIKDALKKQGLRFVGDDIIEERPNPKWYKCIKDYRGFIEGKLYCTNENGDLLSETGGKYVLAISNPFFKEWFRPATEEEIKEISGNNGGISPNCELTEFEKAYSYIRFGGSATEFMLKTSSPENIVLIKNEANQVLEIARKEVLKDLSKLMKLRQYVKGPELIRDDEAKVLLYNGYKIDLKELDKLPKDE